MNDLMNKIIDYGFWLLLIGLLAAYFAGVATNEQAFAGAFTRIAYAVTNRNAQGQYAAYPTGGPAIQAA